MEVGPFIPVLLSLHTNVSFLLLNRNNAEMKRKWGKCNSARLGFPVFGDHMQRLPLNTLFSLVAIDFVEEEEMEKD